MTSGGTAPPSAAGDVSVTLLPATWQESLLQQNRTAARTMLWIVAALYPLFGVLDYLVAPPESLNLLLASRAVVTLATFAMFPLIRGRLFARYPQWVTAAYMLLCAFGIGLMVVVMGGLASPYYAGLNLAMIATGLLFVWPPATVLTTHLLIVAAYLLPNIALGLIGDPFAAFTNFLFLGSTAAIVITGQLFNYRGTQRQYETSIALEKATGQIKESHAQLLALDKFKSQFFANITHELKTPLAMILTPIEMMIEGDLGSVTEGQRATLQAMLRNGTKLLKLINDMLDLSRLEESRLRLAVREHELVGWLRDLVGQVEPLASRKNVSLTFEASAEQVHIVCDIERIERVVVNLLSNATKFTPAQGHIEVRLFDERDQVRVSVADDGVGFAADKARQVFERFFQTEMGEKRRHGGTGIGLALARELVELHGGRIWAESAPGQGATFQFVLRKGRAHFRPEVLAEPDPNSEGALPAPRDLIGAKVAVPKASEYRLLDIAEATERRIVDRDADEHRRPHTVLIVEDNPDVVRIIHMALRRSFKVMAAPDGEKGFELAVRERPNLIITDLMMPGIDGLELARMLREEPTTQHTPIIMLTAHGTTDHRIASIETGVDAYLNKPFSARELITTAHRLLASQQNQAQQLLTQRMDSLETITGGLAHEINNPLNYIKNGVAVLKKDVDRLLAPSDAGRDLDGAALEKMVQRSERMFESIEAGVKRITDAVELMRRYSREGYARVQRAIDVWQAVRDACELLGASVTGKGRVEIELQGQAEVNCVAEEFNQVIGNLVQNALEAVADTDGGLVRVVGSSDATHVTLQVRDNGPGLLLDDPQKVFTPFFTTKGPGRGMGLGLTIVWRVVQAMDGDIQVSSEPGAGTCFTLRLPRASVEDVMRTGEGPARPNPLAGR